MKHKLFSFLLAMVMLLAVAIPVTAAINDTGFEDVAADAWYATAVTYCRDNSLMSGTTATMFDPESTTTRSMLATVLYKMAGAPQVTADNPFSDVDAEAWYGRAVLWAQQNRIVSGYGGGLFGTEDPVTREQIASILWRYAGSPQAESSGDFADESAISAFAAAAVDWARSNGVMNGKENNRFDPSGNVTRAEAATLLMNYILKGKNADTPDTKPAPTEESKVLVAYFSATGTTKALAEYVADALDAQLYEITPEVPYTTADLNYNDSSTRSTIEMNDPSARPAISGSVADMEQYDTVFLGYPIWWGQSPKIISTFLESYDFNGKTIVPFCTSGSSGIGSSADNLHGLASGAAWLTGQRFSGGTSRAAMVDWINSLELKLTAE